jgi:hypothetical protein
MKKILILITLLFVNVYAVYSPCVCNANQVETVQSSSLGISASGYFTEADLLYRANPSAIPDRAVCYNPGFSNQYTKYERNFRSYNSPTDGYWHYAYDVDIVVCTDLNITSADCNASEIFYNGVCTSCPSNASPNSTKDACACNSPYILDANTSTCILPPSYDSNSTNPDGTCKTGYAPDLDNACSPDMDGDGIPDILDPDIDGDGVPNNQDSSPYGGAGKSTPPNPDTNTSCPPGQKVCNGTCIISFLTCQKNNTDCSVGYIPAPDYATTHNCVPENNGQCQHPSASPFGYPFQTITSDVFQCIDLYNAHGGGDNFNCPDGKSVACYYNNDTNSSSSANNNSGTTDTNTSTTSGTNDFNSTTPIDSNASSFNTANIESKLDGINKSLSASGAINNSLNVISKLIDAKGLTNHNDLNNINGSLGSLGSKLDNIRDAINNKPVTPATDMTATNNHLQSIEDKMIKEDSQLDFDNSELDSALNNAKNVFNNALVSFESSYNDIVTLFNGGHTSTVTASGDCFLTGTTKNLGAFTFDFSVLSVLKIPFQFFLNLMLLFFTIKLYVRIARDLVSYITGV